MALALELLHIAVTAQRRAVYLTAQRTVARVRFGVEAPDCTADCIVDGVDEAASRASVDAEDGGWEMEAEGHSGCCNQAVGGELVSSLGCVRLPNVRRWVWSYCLRCHALRWDSWRGSARIVII